MYYRPQANLFPKPTPPAPRRHILLAPLWPETFWAIPSDLVGHPEVEPETPCRNRFEMDPLWAPNLESCAASTEIFMSLN